MINIELLDWQREVYADTNRFKVVAAGRRCGKTHLAAALLIAHAMNGKPGKVFYVAPTQGMARDIMWDKLFDVAGDAVESYNVNNLTITLLGGNTIYLKGADRPDTLRGVSLKFLAMDELAFMKPNVWDAILRPACADLVAPVLFIGTPDGRNFFYDMWLNSYTGVWADWAAWQFMSVDNPFVPKEEIEHARATMPRWAFRQEFEASFDAQGSEFFDPEEFEYYTERPDRGGDYYIAVDLAGFESDRGAKTKRRDNSAMAVVFVDDAGGWWVEDVQFGRWTLDETAQRIFKAVERYRPPTVGIEKGIAQQAVLGPLSDLMRRTHRVFRIELLSHGNQKKQDRILWALQGRFEHKTIRLKRADWNTTFVDEAASFPSQLVHDDLLDALSYIDQLAIVPYATDLEVDDGYVPLDDIAGY